MSYTETQFKSHFCSRSRCRKIRKFPDPWNNFASEKMPDCSSSDYKKKKQLTYLMKKLPLNHLQNLSQLQGRILKKKKEEERKSVLWQTKIEFWEIRNMLLSHSRSRAPVCSTNNAQNLLISDIRFRV
jgi:hypothetical protein